MRARYWSAALPLVSLACGGPSADQRAAFGLVVENHERCELASEGFLAAWTEFGVKADEEAESATIFASMVEDLEPTRAAIRESLHVTRDVLAATDADSDVTAALTDLYAKHAAYCGMALDPRGSAMSMREGLEEMRGKYDEAKARAEIMVKAELADILEFPEYKQRAALSREAEKRARTELEAARAGAARLRQEAEQHERQLVREEFERDRAAEQARAEREDHARALAEETQAERRRKEAESAAEFRAEEAQRHAAEGAALRAAMPPWFEKHYEPGMRPAKAALEVLVAELNSRTMRRDSPGCKALGAAVTTLSTATTEAPDRTVAAVVEDVLESARTIARSCAAGDEFNVRQDIRTLQQRLASARRAFSVYGLQP